MAVITTAAFLRVLQQKFLTNDPDIRLWIIGGGGALNGSYLSGIQWRLAELGIHLSLTGVLGVSTSTPALGYLLGAKPGPSPDHEYNTTVYSVEARSSNFIKFLRTDVAWLSEVFQGSTGKGINYDQVVASRVRYISVVTDWETGQPHYIEPATREEFFTLIKAACSMPGFAPPVPLRDRLMCDSATSDPCPVSWLMEALPVQERPTHILIVANAWHEPPSRFRQWLEWQLSRILFRNRVPRHIIDNFARRHERFYSGVKAALERDDVQVAVEWLPRRQRSLDRNPQRIEDLIRAGYERVKALLE